MIALLFSGLVWVIGCFYLLRPTMFTAMAGAESTQRNTIRRRLRRVNGALLLVLAVAVFWAFRLTEPEPPDRRALLGWFLVLLLTLVVLVLAGVDMVLTRRSYMRRPKGK